MKKHARFGSRPWFGPTIVLALCLSSCSKQEFPSDNAQVPVIVTTAQVQLEDYLAPEEIMGTVASGLRAIISAKLSARVLKVLATPGQHVKAGELLVELDSERARAGLDQARALSEQSARELARYQSLLSTGAITKQELESAEVKAKVAQANLHEAESALSDTHISSPYAGVITRKFIEVGDLTSPSKALLEMEDPTALRFESDLPEGLIDKIQIGQTLEIAAGQGRFEGRVIEISPAADENTRSFHIKVSLPQAAGVRSGQFGRLFVPAHQRKIIRVPLSALVQRGQMQIVYVVKNELAELRLIRSGKVFPDSIEILSGLEAGEDLVVSDISNLKDRDAVQIRESRK